VRFAMWVSVMAIIGISFVTGALAQDYKPGPDSMLQAGVPQGDVTHHTWTSKIFPGTVRDYWVYVPRQYDASKPACVLVCQDGGGFQDRNGGLRLPNVLDNLIAKKEAPVSIAIMINPGVVPAANPNALPRYNRSYEYDNLSDEYARFLLEEILPEVGKSFNLSKDPNDRAICGLSSGGICAFTVAWERPDAFRRVISFVGSFTNLRGGHNYPDFIRKMEPKPIRVFMQDGSNDQDIYSGSWFIGNNDVAAGLKFARYDYTYIVGTGSHSGSHATAILPDAIRWIWRDYPTPIKTPESTTQPIMQVLVANEGWHEAGAAQGTTTAIGCPDGSVYLSGPDRATVLQIKADGKTERVGWSRAGSNYVRPKDGGKAVFSVAGGYGVRLSPGGTTGAFGLGDRATAIAGTERGPVYYSDPKDGRIWACLDGKRRDTGKVVLGATGMSLSPDQTLLYVSTSSPGKFVTSFQIQQNGSLDFGQPYFDMQLPYTSGSSGAAGIVVDTDGRLYVATAIGIQVCDQAGRVTGIIAGPEGKAVTAIAWGGANHDILFAISGDRVWSRKVKVKGVLSCDAPTKPNAPQL
jgi:gluconolactonase